MSNTTNSYYDGLQTRARSILVPRRSSYYSYRELSSERRSSSSGRRWSSRSLLGRCIRLYSLTRQWLFSSSWKSSSSDWSSSCSHILSEMVFSHNHIRKKVLQVSPSLSREMFILRNLEFICYSTGGQNQLYNYNGSVQ